MKYMTKAQLREHLLNAPPGSSPGGIVSALRAQGVQMEGDPSPAPVQKATFGSAALAAAGNPWGMDGDSIVGKGIDALTDLQSYVASPIKAASGLIQTGINSAFGLDGSKNQDIQELPQNAAMARTSLPLTVGLATAPLSLPASAIATGAAAAIGRGMQETSDAVTGKDEQPVLGRIGESLAEGAYAGATSYAAGKAVELASPLLQKALSWAGEKMPGRIINSLMKTAGNEFKFGKNPGAAVVDEGIVASSVDDLYTKVAGRAKEIGEEIERSVLAASAKSPAQINMAPIVSGPLDDAIKAAGRLEKTNAPLVQKLTDLKDDLMKIYGNEQVPLGALQAKREVGDMIKWDATDPFNGPKNEALWKVFEGLKGALNDAVPGLDKLNGRYSEMAAARASIARRLVNIERSNLAGASSLIGGATGFLSGGAPGAVIGAALPKVAGTAGVKTIEAQAIRGLTAAGRSVLDAIRAFAPAERAAIVRALQEFTDAPEQSQP